MDPYQENYNTWNSLAQAYEDKFMNLSIYDHTYDAYCDLLPEIDPLCILETGCGPGNITRYISKRSKNIQLTATDISENMIATARTHVPNAEFIVMDCRDISTIGKKFHGIVSGFCIPYLNLDDGANYFRDCSNLLHQNGLLYLSYVPSETDRSTVQQNSMGSRVHFQFFTNETIIQLLETNNFKMVSSIPVPFSRSEGNTETHMVIIAKKV